MKDVGKICFPHKNVVYPHFFPLWKLYFHINNYVICYLCVLLNNKAESIQNGRNFQFPEAGRRQVQ